MLDEDLASFFEAMYSHFGQFAVIDFVKSRQEHGDLQHIYWRECGGCDLESPFLDVSCLVCGGF